MVAFVLIFLLLLSLTALFVRELIRFYFRQKGEYLERLAGDSPSQTAAVVSGPVIIRHKLYQTADGWYVNIGPFATETEVQNFLKQGTQHLLN